MKFRVIKLGSGSISTGAWISVDADSTVEYNVTATGYTTGSAHEFVNGFVAAGGTGGGNATSGTGKSGGSENKINYIAQNYDSTNSTIYALAVTNMTATSTDVGAGIVWKEVY